MRQIRTVIRSLVTANGYIVAMDDGTIAWNPKNGQHKRIKISAQASVMLGLMNPFGEIARVVVGDVSGCITIISLSEMSVVDRFVTKDSAVRSLCSSSKSDESILVGCENGSILLVGQNVPGRVVTLFKLDGPASALRVVGQSLHIQQGWERLMLDWTGLPCETLVSRTEKSLVFA